MLSIVCILAIAGFVSTIIAVMGKCPLWVPVLFISIVQVLQCLPLR
jgi:hypothetical protein